jgi:hypothetical protein
MTDLQANLSSSPGNVPSTLDTVDRKLNKLIQLQRTLNKETGDYSKKVHGSLGKGAKEIGREVGRELPGGGVIGRAFGGFGHDGILGRVAVGIGLVGVAMKALESVSEVNTKRTEALIEAEEKLAAAREKGEKEALAAAHGGVKAFQQERELTAIGGDRAAGLLQTLTGSHQVDRGEAISGLLKIFKASRKFRTDPVNMVSAALQAFEAGAGFAGAAESVSASPAGLDTALGRRGRAARAFGAQFGLTGAAAKDAFAQGLSNIRGSVGEPLIRQQNAGEAAKTEAEKSTALREATGLDVENRAAAARAKNPGAAASLDEFNENRKMEQKLKKLAANQTSFVDFLTYLTGGGALNELRQRQVARARALFGESD